MKFKSVVKGLDFNSYALFPTFIFLHFLTILALLPSTPTSNVKAVIPLNDPVVVTERMYNNPITHVGPELEDTILPYIVHLREKKIF